MEILLSIVSKTGIEHTFSEVSNIPIIHIWCLACESQNCMHNRSMFKDGSSAMYRSVFKRYLRIYSILLLQISLCPHQQEISLHSSSLFICFLPHYRRYYKSLIFHKRTVHCCIYKRSYTHIIHVLFPIIIVNIFCFSCINRSLWLNNFVFAFCIIGDFFSQIIRHELRGWLAYVSLYDDYSSRILRVMVSIYDSVFAIFTHNISIPSETKFPQY